VQSGIILLNKEKGISSNKAVNQVKKALGADKAGHLGTLDVLATGLLPVTINKATKLFDYFLSKDKVYKTIFTFGQTTDTLDLEGEITHKDDKVITKDMLLQVLPSFIGKQSQMPPAYSAKKINGQKAYDLARKGNMVELKPKEIEIFDLQFLREVEKNTFELLVHCSSGTYIRALCRDIADKLSTCGVMSFLQRTRCGIFDIKNSFTFEDIKNGKFEIVSPEQIFDFDKIDLNENDFAKLANGQKVYYDKDGSYKAYFKGEYLGNLSVKDNAMKFEIRFF
jgi:tRNA pseudouridine55 synthase